MKRISQKLTYANVMATIAVFLVLGGGAAFAAGKLGKNTVGTKQLKNNAVTSAKVKNGSLLSGDFKAGQIPAGPQGPQGVPGSAKAWAVISNTGAVIRGLNISGVSNVGTGLYCITVANGLNTTNSAALATLDYSDPFVLDGDSITIASQEAFNGCPSHTQFQVHTSNNTGTAKNDGFDFMIP